MTLKKLLIFPAVGMGLVLLAMIFGIAAVANEGLGSAATVMYIGVSLSALIPFCLHTIALVGSLRKNIAMIIVGSCIVLFLSYVGNGFLAACAMEGANQLATSFIWVFFGMTTFTSIMLFIAGIVSIGSKGNSAFLMVSAILSILFYFGFAIVVTAAQRKPLVLLTSLCFTSSFLVVLASMLAVSILGIRGKTQDALTDEVPEQPGLTHTPKDLRLAKEDPAQELLKWKELLDKGAITQDDYDKKKDEILNR